MNRPGFRNGSRGGVFFKKKKGFFLRCLNWPESLTAEGQKRIFGTEGGTGP